MKTNVVSLASTSSVRRRKFSTSWLPSVSFNVTVSSTTTEVGFFWPTLFAKDGKFIFSNFFLTSFHICYVLFCTENLSDTSKLFNLFIFLILCTLNSHAKSAPDMTLRNLKLIKLHTQVTSKL